MSERPLVARYGAAIAVTVIAVVARLGLDPLWGMTLPLITFYPAIMASAWFGGFGPGIAATLLSAGAAKYFWMDPRYGLYVAGAPAAVALATFALTGAFISAVTEALHRARRRQVGALEQEQAAAAAIAASEARLRVTLTMLDSGFDAIIVRDAEDRVTGWNRGAAELYGWTREEALGQVTHSLFQTQFPKPLEEILADVRRDDRWEGELVHTRKDGASITVFSRQVLERDAEGRPVSILETNMDITDRKRAEEALRGAYQNARARQREAESLATVASTLNTLDLGTVLETIAESASSLLDAEVATVFRLDPDSGRLVLAAGGGPRGATLERNVSVPRGAGLVWLAVDKREAVASADLLTDPRFVYPPATRARIEAGRHRAGLAIPLVVKGRVTGALFVGVLPGRVLNAEEVRLLTAFADQAAVAIANAELYDEARRASRAKDQFLAMLSHELRQPLSTTLGWVRILKSRRIDAIQQDRALDAIERSAKAQARMVDDLLDIARIEAGKVTLDRRAVAVGPLVAEVVESLRYEAETNGITIETAIETTPGVVSVDMDRLRQVIANLMGNAMKYTPSGGRIDVRATSADDVVRIVVTDTGVGIEPDLLPHVFERFRQADARGAASQGGLGLGLAIVRQLVEMHGGTVEARSDGPDRGSTFIVALPRTTET